MRAIYICGAKRDKDSWTTLCINRPSDSINKIEFVAPSSFQKFKLTPQKLLPPNIYCNERLIMMTNDIRR